MIKEDEILIAVMDWVRLKKLDNIIWHCANERKCSPQQGAFLKRKGVKAGVSDIIIMRASRGFHGAFMELKTKSGRLSPSQAEFLETACDEGYCEKVCYSIEDAIDFINWYLKLG